MSALNFNLKEKSLTGQLKSLIVYHTGCADGFLAASLLYARCVLNSDCTMLPWDYKDYSQLQDVLKYDGVYFVDCAPSIQYLRDYHSARSKSFKGRLMIFDHHETALKNIGQFKSPWVDTVLDLGKAGCQIVWNFLFPQVPEPWYVSVVADRDLWLWQYPHSKELNRGLGFLPQLGLLPLGLLTHLEQLDQDQVFRKGVDLLFYDEWKLYELQQQSTILTFTPPFAVPGRVFECQIRIWEAPEDYDHPNTGHLISEFGNRMAEGYGCSIQVWRDGGLSFRSVKGQPQSLAVNDVAEIFGGGGHPNAAGAKTGLTFTFPGALTTAYPMLFRN